VVLANEFIAQERTDILQDWGASGVFQYEDVNKTQLMKRILVLLLAGVALAGGLRAQPGATNPRLPLSPLQQAEKEKSLSSLSRFDLDFPGGRPEQLVNAIEKASGKPLNAIIPQEHQQVELPPLKMKGVNVAELFEALGKASVKRISYVTGTYFGGINSAAASKQYQSGVISYGFQTSGTPREDSIWYFYYEAPGYPRLGEDEAASTCRFYQLEPYLQKYKVEDITTAIETGWKMMGNGKPVKMSFHKDTKLLIAVGEPEKLKMIDSVLEQLKSENTTNTAQRILKELQGGAKVKPESKARSGEPENQ
jgi:hypothetical protein